MSLNFNYANLSVHALSEGGSELGLAPRKAKLGHFA